MPEMVAPIAPNTFQGRRSVQSSTPFPFPNCYHWIKTEAFIRVKARPEKFDYAQAVRLTSLEHLELVTSFTGDFACIADFKRRKRDEEAAAAGITFNSDSGDSHSEPEPKSASDSESCQSDERPDDSHTASSVSSATTVFDSLLQEDIFGWNPNPNFGLMPLVDLWFELDEHLTPDTIPSPLDLYEEEKTIRSCVFSSPIYTLYFVSRRPFRVESSSVHARGEDVNLRSFRSRHRTCRWRSRQRTRTLSLGRRQNYGKVRFRCQWRRRSTTRSSKTRRANAKVCSPTSVATVISNWYRPPSCWKGAKEALAVAKTPALFCSKDTMSCIVPSSCHVCAPLSHLCTLRRRLLICLSHTYVLQFYLVGYHRCFV